MSDLVLFACLSVSFRWFIFEFRHTRFIRQILGFIWGDRLSRELFSCPYCQTVEAASVVGIAAYFAGLKISLYLLPFALLLVGFIGMLTAPIVNFLLDLLEQEE